MNKKIKIWNLIYQIYQDISCNMALPTLGISTRTKRVYFWRVIYINIPNIHVNVHALCTLVLLHVLCYRIWVNFLCHHFPYSIKTLKDNWWKNIWSIIIVYLLYYITYLIFLDNIPFDIPLFWTIKTRNWVHKKNWLLMKFLFKGENIDDTFEIVIYLSEDLDQRDLNPWPTTLKSESDLLPWITQ